jgi:hypothetical protein
MADYGLKVSKPGQDVLVKNVLSDGFNSNDFGLLIKQQNNRKTTGASDTDFHGLGYEPITLAWSGTTTTNWGAVTGADKIDIRLNVAGGVGSGPHNYSALFVKAII